MSFHQAHRARKFLDEGKPKRALSELMGVRLLHPNTYTVEMWTAVRDLTEEALRHEPHHANGQALLRTAHQELEQLIARAPQEVAEEHTRAEIQRRFAGITATSATRNLSPAALFEYDVVEVAPADSKHILARAGSLGWELVGVTSAVDGVKERLFLKRLVSVARASGAATAGAAGAFGFLYAESGPDLDLDGDVDGGLMDSIQSIFE